MSRSGTLSREEVYAILGDVMDPEAAQEHFAEAARLWPENWAYQRQARQLADPAAVGELDAGPEFWKSVEARGRGSFYPEIELADLD